MDKASFQKDLKKIPGEPGVYIFRKLSLPIYIGKAKNLKNRIGSYFTGLLTPKTSRMVKEADSLNFIKVNSELEALLLEASLIKKYQPKYNSAAKDDKHPLYIRITKEKYPRVLTARREALKEKNLAIYGPFPSSANVRSVLTMLRRIFPFSDHKIGKKPCLYSQIGECNPCPNEIERIENQELRITERKRYLHNIRMIKNVLSGRIDKVMRELKTEMKRLSKAERFEKASVIREQVKRLEYITQPIIPTEYFLENPNLTEDLRKKELKELKKLLVHYKLNIINLSRIECYDVAHLAGTSPTASMVSFINGEADKSYYRNFRVRQGKSRDDLASLAEVGKRRSKYFDAEGGYSAWGTPNLIIVDGGKTQVRVFTELFDKFGIPVVGIAKRYETLVLPDGKEVRLKRGPALNLVQRIRDEAHRFARRYHHQLLRRNLLAINS